jgi:hypothetical protein
MMGARLWPPAGATTAVVTLLIAGAGCGGGSGDVVATVGGTPVTRVAVNHWMATLAGGDYFELSGQNAVPDGLVSDPPNYPRCVARLEAAAASSPKRFGTEPTGAQLLTKCEQLTEALRLQATEFLIRSQRLMAIARDQGVTASDNEIQHLFKRVNAEQFPRPGELQQYLASRKESVADDLFLLQLDLLSNKMQEKIDGGGQPARAKLAELERKWRARTDCHAGYVVEYCKQHTKGPVSTSNSPSAAVLMEQVATIATGRCINLAACGRQ